MFKVAILKAKFLFKAFLIVETTLSRNSWKTFILRKYQTFELIYCSLLDYTDDWIL